MIVKFNRKRNPGHPDDFALEEGYQKWAIAYYEELEFNSQHSEVIKFTFLFNNAMEWRIKITSEKKLNPDYSSMD